MADAKAKPGGKRERELLEAWVAWALAVACSSLAVAVVAALVITQSNEVVAPPPPRRSCISR